MSFESLQSLLSKTQVLRIPRKRLATFGATTIDYHLLSPMESQPHTTRVREGSVISKRPTILTPESFKQRFEGFGEDVEEFTRWISNSYHDLLRALEYNFQNQGQTTRTISSDSRLVSNQMLADFDSRGIDDRAVITCPDNAWSLALMKFTLDEAERSFPVHVKDMERRQLFSADRGVGQRHRNEVESLFDRATKDRSLLPTLSKKLHDYGLFEEYEDRFLNLY